VTGLIYGTSTDISGSTSALPSATDDNKVFVFDVDCRYRKEFLKPVVTIGNGSTGAYTTMICVLSKAGSAPTTATNRGAANVLRA